MRRTAQREQGARGASPKAIGRSEAEAAPRGRKIAGAAGVGLCTLAFLMATCSHAAAQPGEPRLVLKDISTLVFPGDVLRLAVDTAEPMPPDLDLVVSIYPPVPTRSEFDLIAEGTPRGRPIDVRTYRPAELSHTESGFVVERVVAGSGTDPLRLNREGVYPMLVSLLRRDFTDASTLLTFFVHFPARPLPPPLRVGLVVPVEAPPAETPDGAVDPSFGATIRGRLQPLAATVRTASALRVPLTIPVSPLTVDEWARAASADATLVAGLSDLVQPGMQYVARPYADLPTSVLAEPRLDGEVNRQFELGRQVLAAHGITPNPNVAVTPDPPFGLRTLRRLAATGARQVVMQEAALEPLDLPLTLTRPFQVDLRDPRLDSVLAVSVDPVLSAVASRPTDQPRAMAARLFAEITQLYLDRPADLRGVVIAVNRGAVVDPQAWQPFLSDLARAGYLVPVSMSDLFAAVPVAPDGADAQRRLTRTLRTTDASLPSSLVASFLDAAARIDSLEAMTGAQQPVESARRLLTLAEGQPIDGSRWLAGVDRIVAGEVAKVRVVTPSSVTLAASDGAIPITIQNGAGIPVTITISLDSDRLRFPAGSSLQVTLAPRTQTVNPRVEALTTGSFPMEIQVTSPCPARTTCPGLLRIGPSVRLTVTSTKASAVAVGAAVGAALFLLLWWGRQFTGTRRRRTLNPTTGPADETEVNLHDDRGQVALLKVIVLLAVFAFVAIDLGRPLLGRVTVDTDAHSIAAVSADDWRGRHDDDEARARAAEETAKIHGRMTDWSVRSDGAVTVSIEKDLSSWVFGKILKSWYVVKATATEKGTN